jgi:hypothetical protein
VWRSKHDSETLRRLEKRAKEPWKEEWLYYCEHNWTRRVIDNSYIFEGKRNNVDHYTTQNLTDRGIFNSYRKTVNKESHLRCWECNAEYSVRDLLSRSSSIASWQTNIALNITDERQRGFRLVDGVCKNVMILTAALRESSRNCKVLHVA